MLVRKFNKCILHVGHQFVRQYYCSSWAAICATLCLHWFAEDDTSSLMYRSAARSKKSIAFSKSCSCSYISPSSYINSKVKKNNTNSQDHNILSRTELNFSNGFFGLRGRNNNSEIHPNDSSKTQQGLRILLLRGKNQ